jgi:hypothetical protein
VIPAEAVMKLAIMQPYFFPYIGYYQLIHAVDKFVIYDDVSFIKQGWINRNRILVSGQASYITVPLAGASSFKPIRDIQVSTHSDWQTKLLKTIAHSYKKAPFFEPVFPLIERIVRKSEDHISRLAIASLLEITQYLDIDTEVLETSIGYQNSHLQAQDRVIDICKLERASHYINPIGGVSLYSTATFMQSGIHLSFLKPTQIEYRQLNHDFIPWLSIIDVLMFNGKEKTCDLINQYELIGW